MTVSLFGHLPITGEGFPFAPEPAAKTLKLFSFGSLRPLWILHEIDSEFFNNNNRVYLEDVAYTVVTDSSFKGFPEDTKLIAVPVQVKSDEYIRGEYALTGIYIGFAGNNGDEYRKP